MRQLTLLKNGALQATIRSGGRNGISFSANFRYALGKGPEKKIDYTEPEIKHIQFEQKIIDLNVNREDY